MEIQNVIQSISDQFYKGNIKTKDDVFIASKLIQMITYCLVEQLTNYTDNPPVPFEFIFGSYNQNHKPCTINIGPTTKVSDIKDILAERIGCDKKSLFLYSEFSSYGDRSSIFDGKINETRTINVAVLSKDPNIDVIVETLTGKKIKIKTSSNESCASLCIRLQNLEGIPIDQQRLIFAGRQLEKDRSLADYNIHDGCKITLVLRLRGGMFQPTSGVDDYKTISGRYSENKTGLIDEINDNIKYFSPIRTKTLITTTKGLFLNLIKIMDKLESEWSTRKSILFKSFIAKPNYINQEFVQRMIDREVELRKSNEYLSKMTQTEDEGRKDWMNIVEELQEQVVKEFGFENIKYGLHILRTATQVYDLERIPFYVKFNRAKKGHLKIGDNAPNIMLHDIENDNKLIPLYNNDNKITFVFAGVITWPPFRSLMPIFKDMIDNKIYKKVNFVVVYCQEAHALDEWDIGSKYKVNQHKILEERINAAKYMQNEFGYHHKLLIDQMSNIFQDTYASWPTRYYLIKNGKMEYIVEPLKATFLFDGIVNKLHELLEIE